MPFRNGQILSKRKHGASFPKFGLFSSLLFTLCCLEAWGWSPAHGDGGSGRSCGSPCPGNCTCVLAPGSRESCVVNCTNIGLERGPAAGDLPPGTNVLDLSRNRISSLEPSLFDQLTSLRELYLQDNRISVLPRGVFCSRPLFSILDLSNNQITTIEEDICDHLFNLTEIDLSSNPFVCDCKLFRLVSWLQERGVRVRHPENMLCVQPPDLRHQPLLNVSLLTCGLNYAACLEDSDHSGGGSELVIFSSSTPGNFSREECNSVCYGASQRYGGLGARRECLCSTNYEPNRISEAQCSAACTKPHVMKECGWTLAHDVFVVDFAASLPPFPPVSVHSSAHLSILSSVTPVTLSWDFGDLSPRVNATETVDMTTRHKYAVPGRYPVSVTAWAGPKEVCARREVRVTLPPRLELHCPPLTVANQSLAVRLVSWGGEGVAVDWRITKDGQEAARATPYCPRDAVFQCSVTDSSQCFQLVPGEFSWSEARRQCSSTGGDLAVVRTDPLRRRLADRVTQCVFSTHYRERSVWLGLSDVDSPGSLRWVDGSEALEGEGGGRDRATLVRGKVCVSLDHTALPSSHPCSTKRAYVCQYSPQVRVTDAGVYLVGLAVFPTHRPLCSHAPTPLSSPEPPARSIELLLFPALGFVQAGRVSSVEFICQELSSHTQLVLQIYRPHCGQHPGLTLLLPGCGGLLCHPVALCVSMEPSTSTPLPSTSCPPPQQWCPFLGRCLPLASPCHPASCANCTQADTLPPGALRPSYSLVDEVVVTLPAGPVTHILVRERVEDLLVSPGDIIGLQHDAGPASLLRCDPSPQSPWRQPILALNQSDWLWANSNQSEGSVDLDQSVEITLEDVRGGVWAADVVCPIRVLYVGHSETQLQGSQLSSGLPQPGLYSLEVTSDDPAFPVMASCPILVVPPLGLTVLHPPSQNGTYYFRPNQTVLLLRVHSQYGAKVHWQGSNQSVLFQDHCPPDFLPTVGECRGAGRAGEPGRGGGNQSHSLFAVIDLGLGEERGPVVVNLSAHSEVTEASLSLLVGVEEPLRGLVVQPHPRHRVLMESVVSYTAAVEGGSSPTFKWTVDDKPYFTYYNTVLNIIYQNPAVYKLSVTAMNHVSNLTDHFNVTVDRMNPMVNLTVTGVPGVVTQGSDQFLTTSVVLDVSVDATFRWSFGDGGYQEYDFKPPYNTSLYPPLPDSPTQVLLPNKVKYKYQQPGVYTVLVSVSNHYENRTQRIDMHVYSVLTHVDIETEPRLLQAGQPAAFEAHALPSAYGIVYTWDFADGSASREGPQRRVNHTYGVGHSGVHNVCVSVNNTISWTKACAEMLVYEEIKGLTATSSAPTELNTPTTVSAHLQAGNNVTWSFDMGDGSMVTTAGSELPHTYVKDGNYTVNVTARNAVSARWTLVPVQVFVLQVVRLEPAGCVRELTQVDFQAFVSGNASSHLYEWSFGDGTPNQTHLGSPRISHSYLGSGDYHLSLLLSSGVNKANFFAWVCVQPAVSNVTLTPEKCNFRLGEESRFRASARPDFGYTYLWDFGVIEDSTPVQGHTDMVFTYKNPGQYLVTVTVSNNISCSNDSVLIQIQRPVGLVLIQHNGTRSNNLTLREVYLFTTSSLAPASLYTWDFGDGTPLTPGPNATHAYNVSGVFNVTLTAANPVSSNHTRVAVAVLAPIRGLVVNADRVNVPINATVNFKAHLEEGDGVRFSWNLCDGCTPRLQEWKTHYTFRSVGTYNVIVTAESDVGSAQASVYIYVLRELEGLQIQPEEEMGGEGGCCYATNRVLHLQAALREGTNMSFSWNLLRELAPVSTALNLSGKTIPVNFSTPGPCDVFLRATNLLGTLVVNRTIQFLDPVGELYLETSVNPVAVNSSTNLTVLASKGSDLQYRWSADEGALGWNEPSVVHQFTVPGMKVVTVEVSNEVSADTVSKFIDVQEVVTGVTFSATNVTEQNFVATGVNVSLHGELRTGTNVSWTWLLLGRTEMGRRVSHVFQEPGPFTVMLNATNDVSGEAFSRELTVQDKIQGLELRASKRIAAVGERVEFTIAKASGTNVSFILSISGDSTVFGLNQTYVHQFSRVDTYMVNLTAHNQVSSERRHLQVEVMEPVSMLSILDCCDAAMPVGVKKTLVADILTGNPVTFLWTFDLNHLPLPHIGKEVTYIPDQAGSLTIYLRAFNLLNGQNITKHIQVQNVLTEARVEARPRDTFINKTVMLMAGVTPQSTPVTFLWDFRDGSAPLLSTTSSVEHVYAFPGQYLVQVNCSNLVSWVIARVEVTIRVLECEEPEVQVVQAPRLAIWRYQPTLVEASVDLKACIRYGAQYLWEIFSTPHCNYDHSVAAPLASKIPLPGEVDVRRLQLSLPKMSLRSGNYSLVFSLSYQGVPLRKAACLQLTVMAARLVPIIEGGTYRVWSKTQDLQLSAEQSYDPNMSLDNQSLLHYHWDCVTTSKGPSYCSSLNFGLGSSGPVLGIPGSELQADVEYTFRLTVRKEGMAPESTTQTVLVQSGRIPMVYLECVSCKAQSIFEVSQNSYVYLAGTCTNCHHFHRGRWTAVTLRNETLVLDSSSTTTGRDSMNLVLRQGFLQDGHSYVFTLHVTDGNMDREGVASITLQPNMPPAGGDCDLRVGGGGEGGPIRTLVDRVYFNCSGYSDLGVSETPLLYSLLVTRCSDMHCEEFCVYKGTSPEHSAFLPPGFRSGRYRVSASITVEDHQGAAITALNKSVEVVLPDSPPGYSSLPHWLSELTTTTLRQLLKQGDSQRVRELSLALITVLNEYEQTRESPIVSRAERGYRVIVRSDITRALTALDLITVNDIQQTSAALAQCTAVSREFICEECQNSTLNKLELMLDILETDTKQGTVTPTEIADNILNIMGDLIHQVSQSASQQLLGPPDLPLDSSLPQPHQPPEDHPLRIAAKAYNLSSALMRILMHSRVLNEEPLVLRGTEIAATGKRADPQSLFCYHDDDSPECRRFSIPRAFNNSLSRAATSVVQLMFHVEPNPFPFNFVANYTVSTEVASMEFQAENGSQIPISDLDDNQAITVAVNNGGATDSNGAGVTGVPLARAINVSRCDSVIVRVSAGNSNQQAGLFIQLNFTTLDDGVWSEVSEADPSIMTYLHSSNWPNEFNFTDRKRITLSMTRGRDLDHRKYTFFLSPESHDTTLDYYVNVTTGCTTDSPSAGVRLEVGVFTSLCQYFSESAKLWRTDGMVPLAETNASRAVCSTRHLTAFAASLFVPPDAVTFIRPERGVPSLVVLLTCVVGLLCYAVAAAILHKLDQLDLRRAGTVPLCGHDGTFKYEVQVKTGFSRGAGTSAHVGISVYGCEGRSGHRHLDSPGAFARNGLDIFHIATETSLGSVWKIRVWHDNKGLSPAWKLQYVLVKDLQTGSSYYFLVEEWLSVDNERTNGGVEIEVEVSEEAELRRLPRLLNWELQRALCESHLWLSLWERPVRSPFTRLQRATCCALLLQLCLLANTMWYSTVANRSYSSVAVSSLVVVDVETVAVGVVSCLVIYPLYLLVFTLFRMSRSKCVSVEQVPSSQVDQESVEIDDFLDNSMAGSSFLIFNGVPGETYSEETNVDLPPTPSTKSVQSWGVVQEEDDDEERDWPELLSDMSEVGGAGLGAGLPKLKRGQGSRHLGVDMTLHPDNDDLTHRNKYFTSSDEDLIKRILADGQLQVSHLCDPQHFFSQTADSETADLSSIFGDKTEVVLLQKMNEPLSLGAVKREPPRTAFTSRTVVTDVCSPRRFPPWCGQAALWVSWSGLVLANGLSVWAGRGFSDAVALMWLISCIGSFLSSCLLLEPIKVLLEGLYFALWVKRLRPEEQDVLVECPRVDRVVQRVPRVRPPQGFALSQARQQARKVHMLHNMLKNFLVYMLFLLVVLLLNYSDTTKDTHSLRLRTQLQLTLHTPDQANISRREDVWAWLSGSLLPRLLDSTTLMQETGSVLLGTPRLRQIRDGSIHGAGAAGWGEGLTGSAVHRKLTQNWTLHTADDNGAWRWGQVMVYGSGGFVQQLNRNIEETRTSLQYLQQLHWMDHMTRAVFVEFSLYNTNTDLLAFFSFLFEFPVSEHTQSSLDLLTFRLQPITGLDLQLQLTILLFSLVVYFCVCAVLGLMREGWVYLLCPWRLLGACSLALAACVCGLHISRCAAAGRLWASYLRQRDGYTDFYPLARQSQAYTLLSALLLFILVLKASHQLRFLREWAVFGRALRRSVWELIGTGLVLLVLLLAYSHTGHLLFHSVMDGYGSVSSACLSLLGAGGRGLLSLRPSSTTTGPSSSASSLVFHVSFAVLRLALLWLVTSALLRNYRRARAELYRPVVDLQDYEMVELFLRRLKMWMGLSRTKEFRHKVRFEGMEPPPSRSSSTSDCQSLCLPPLDGSESPPSPGSLDGTSEASWRPTSSSPCSLTEAPGMGLSLGPGGLGPGALAGGTAWRERAETEATLKRLLPTLDALLQQLDRVTVATEELYRTECVLERAQRKGGGPRGGKGRRGEKERGESREGRGGKGRRGEKERGESRVGRGGKGRRGEKERGDEKDSAGQRERKGGQQKVNTVVGVVGVAQPKDTGNSGANPKHTPKPTPVPVPPPTSTPALKSTPVPVPPPTSTPALKSTPVPVPPPTSTPAPKSTPVPVPPPTSTPALKSTPVPVPPPTSTPALKSTPVPLPPPISTPAMKSAPDPTPISTPALKPTPKSTPVSAPIPDPKCTPVSPHIISPALTPAPAPVPLSTPALPSTPAPSSSSTPAPREWDPPTERETLPPSSLFNHPAHTTTIPTRKRKPPPLKNKVHPNPDRHVSGHPKP